MLDGWRFWMMVTTTHTWPLEVDDLPGGESLIKECKDSEENHGNGDQDMLAAVSSFPFTALNDPEKRKLLHLGSLGSENWDVRATSAVALAPWVGDPKVRQALMERAEDEEPLVRVMAVRSLSTVSNDAAVRGILVKKMEERDSSVRWEAIKALARSVDEPQVRHALALRAHDEDRRVRETARKALSAEI